MMPPEGLALRASVLTMSAGELRYLEDGLLRVGPNGRITALAPFAGSTEPYTDWRPHLIVPGYVDAHVHFPQTRIIGSASGELLSWLERSVFPEEARFANEAYAREVAIDFVSELARNGTTLSAIFSSSFPRATELLLEEIERTGLKAHVGLTLMDQNCPEALRSETASALQSLEALTVSYHHKDSGRLRIAVTPRFAISCSRALMEGAARIANDYELLIQTHVSENPREGDETLRCHPWAKNYLDVYDAVGLLGKRTLLAHAIHLSDAEREVLSLRGAAVAHCPDSNLFLGSGKMELARTLDEGVRVGLGSDVAAGRSFDIRDAISHAYDVALMLGRPLDPATLFALSTLGGASALGLAHETGSLEVGKDADFVLLGGASTDREGALRMATFARSRAPVRATYVRGRPIFRS